MMNWQNVVVAIIGVAVAAAVVWRVVCMFRSKRFDPCRGCQKDCPLKKLKSK